MSTWQDHINLMRRISIKKRVFYTTYGPWALVTGSSSGIGAEFARQLAAIGMNLLLVARRKDRLDQLADELTASHGIEVRVLVQDLASVDFMTTVKRATQELEIGLLVNAAGFAITGPLLENPIEDEQRLLNVNCLAPLLLAHHFGNKMRDRGRGGIIFLASIVAFSAVPQWSNYAASKAYNLLLAEGLGEELKRDGVEVLALSPGPTATEFQQVAGIRDFMVMDAKRVVTDALRAIGRRRLLIPGWLNRYNNFCLVFFPRSLNTWIFGSIIERVRLKNG